jgi:hypothetical protein
MISTSISLICTITNCVSYATLLRTKIPFSAADVDYRKFRLRYASVQDVIRIIFSTMLYQHVPDYVQLDSEQDLNVRKLDILRGVYSVCSNHYINQPTH